MRARRVTVKVTANFEANILSIESFLADAGATAAFVALLETLAESVIPNLERFPRMGRLFLDVWTGSVEARDRVVKLRGQIGDAELREYVTGDYLILYAVIETVVYLLSIKHHRQLSFNFARHWPPG